MYEIPVTATTGVLLESADLLTANTDFYHIDRVAPFHVLIYCLSGAICVAEEGTEYNVLPGELLLLKSGLHQTPTRPITAGSSWIYVHFYTYEPEPFIENFPGVTSSDSPMLYLPKYLHGLSGSSPDEKLRRLIDLVHRDTPVARTQLSPALHTLLLDLIEWGTDRADSNLSDRIAEYLSAHTREHLSTGDLEQFFHLSYKYLEHQFKQQKGIPIMQYHTQLRLRECAKVLRTTTLPVSSVGEMYGFQDSLYFSRIFKKHMGMSPVAYRIDQLTL